MRRTQKAHLSRTIGLYHAFLRCFLESFSICVNDPQMKKFGVYELRACFIFNIYLFGCIGSWLQHVGFSLIVARGLSSCSTGLSYPEACGILVPQPNPTHRSCIERQILNHWTIREVPESCFISVWRMVWPSKVAQW